MSINSDDLETILDAETLKALGVKIDYVNKKVYVTAHRDNVDFIKEYMEGQDFNFVGESVKIRYDHAGVGCQDPVEIIDPQDPIRCYEFSSSSSSSLGEEICTPSIELDIYGTTVEGVCDPVTKTLEVIDGCGCDETNNCSWRQEELPSWYEVFDTNASDYIILNFQLNKSGTLYTETSLPLQNTKVIGKDQFGATPSVNLSGDVDYWYNTIEGSSGVYAEWRRIDWHAIEDSEAKFEVRPGAINTRQSYLSRKFIDEWNQISVSTAGNQWVNSDPDLTREVFSINQYDTNSNRNLESVFPLRFNSSNNTRYQFVYSDISYSNYEAEFVVYNALNNSDIDHDNNQQWAFVLATWEDTNEEFDPAKTIQNGSGTHPVVHTLSIVRNCNTSPSTATVNGLRASLVLDYYSGNQKIIADLSSLVPLESMSQWNRYVSKIKVTRNGNRFTIRIGNAVNMDYDQNPTDDYYQLMAGNRDYITVFDLDSYVPVDSLTTNEESIMNKFKGSAPWGIGNRNNDGVWCFDEQQLPYDPEFGESVLIDLTKIRQDHPNDVFFELSAKAKIIDSFDFIKAGLRLSVERYNGGTPEWNGYHWIINGGVLIKEEETSQQVSHLPWTQYVRDRLQFFPGNTNAKGAIYNFFDGTNPEQIRDKYGYDDNTSETTLPISNIDHVTTYVEGNIKLNSGSITVSGDGLLRLEENQSMFSGAFQYTFATEIAFVIDEIPDNSTFNFIMGCSNGDYATFDDGEYAVYLHDNRLWVTFAPDTGNRWYEPMDVEIETGKFYHLVINHNIYDTPQTRIYLNSKLIFVSAINVDVTFRDYNIYLGGAQGRFIVKNYQNNLITTNANVAPDYIAGVGGYFLKGTFYGFAHYRNPSGNQGTSILTEDMVMEQYRNIQAEKFIDLSNKYFNEDRVALTNHYFQQDDSFTQVKVENVRGDNLYVLRQVERSTYYSLDFDPEIIIDDVLDLDRCPCIFAPQRTCIDYNVNVLVNIKEDFDSALNNYEYIDGEEIKNIAKIQEGNHVVNNCHGEGNIYQPNGVFVEDQELYDQWVSDLTKGSFSVIDNGEIVKRRCVEVFKLTEDCDFESSSSSYSSFSSESSVSGESSNSSSSSRSSESSSSESSSESSVSESSNSSTSANSSSSDSSASESSSSSSFDERCEPKIYGQERFGQSIAFTENGSRVFISSLNDAKIWVYDIHQPNPPTGVPGYTFVETITGPTDIDFGWSISVSADGSELLVGAPGYDNEKGRVYHYTDSGGFSLAGSYTPVDSSGITVENPKGDRFGHVVDVSSDGQYFAVGSPYHKSDLLTNGWQAGAVYVLDNALTLREKVQPDDGQQQDVFGWDVSINSDGSRFAASSFDDDDLGIRSGSAYVFDWNGSSYDLNVKVTASDGDDEQRFGKSISLAEYADVLIVGAYKDSNGNGVYAGAVYEYRFNGTSWVETKIVTTDSVDGSSFGFDVDVNSCGNAFIATALSYQEEYEDIDGDAYVFTYNGSWTEELKFSDNLETTDRYGYVAAISENGIYVATSSPTYNVEDGMVHIYNLDSTCYNISVDCVDVVESSSSGTTSSSQSSISTSSSSSSSSSSSELSSSSSSSSVGESSSSSESSFRDEIDLHIYDPFTNEVSGYVNGNLFGQTGSYRKGIGTWNQGDNTSDVQIVDFNPPPMHPDIDYVMIGALRVQYTGPRHADVRPHTVNGFSDREILETGCYMSLFIHLDDFISDGEDTAWALVGINEDDYGDGINKESMFIGVSSDNNAINYITIAYGEPGGHLYKNRKQIYPIFDPTADILVVLKVNTPNVSAWVFDANDVNRPNIGTEASAGSPIFTASNVSSFSEVRDVSVVCGGVPAVAPVYFKNFRVGYTWDSVTQQ